MSKEAKVKDAPAKPHKVQVVNNGAKLRTFNNVQIGPGITAIDSEVADRIKAHPHYLKLKAAGLMSISEAPPATKGKSVVEAEAQIDQTHDTGLLDEYAADDHRPEVMKAIRTKHAELDKKPGAEDKD